MGIPTGKLQTPRSIPKNTAPTAKAVAAKPATPATVKTPDGFDAKKVTPRDAASGLPTGQRMHKPFI